MSASNIDVHVQANPGAGAAMLSNEDRNLTPKALGRIDFESELSERRYGEHQAHMQSQDRIKLAIADAATSLSAATRVEKPDREVEAHFQRVMEAEETKFRERQIDFDHKRALKAGSQFNAVREFAKKNRRPTRDANTTDELLSGQDPRGMVDHYREAHKAAKAAKARTIKTKRPATEFLPVIDKAVDGLADKTLSMQLAFVKSVNLNEDLNKLETGRFELPELSVANALGGLTMIPNAMGLLCAIDPDAIKRRLHELALQGHDDSKTLPMADRMAALAKIDAELLDIERKSEFWVRQCFALGLEPGPRLGSAHPLAILDLEYV